MLLGVAVGAWAALTASGILAGSVVQRRSYENVTMAIAIDVADAGHLPSEQLIDLRPV